MTGDLDSQALQCLRKHRLNFLQRGVSDCFGMHQELRLGDIIPRLARALEPGDLKMHNLEVTGLMRFFLVIRSTYAAACHRSVVGQNPTDPPTTQRLDLAACHRLRAPAVGRIHLEVKHPSAMCC